MSENPDTTSDRATDPVTGTGQDAEQAVLASDPPVRHEGTQFEPVPRTAATTSRPYPPEADPATQEDTAPAQVPGEQTDPTRRSDVFPDDGETDDAGRAEAHVVPGSDEPPD